MTAQAKLRALSGWVARVTGDRATTETADPIEGLALLVNCCTTRWVLELLSAAGMPMEEP